MNRTELLKESYAKIRKRKTPPVPRNKKAPKKGGPKTCRTRHMALRVTEALGARVDQAAAETCRTSSNWVETAILWALNQGAIHTRQVVPQPREDDGTPKK